MHSRCAATKCPPSGLPCDVGIHLLIKLGGRGGEGVDEESDREEDEQPVKDDEQEAARRRRKDDTLQDDGTHGRAGECTSAALKQGRGSQLSRWVGTPASAPTATSPRRSLLASARTMHAVNWGRSEFPPRGDTRKQHAHRFQ